MLKKFDFLGADTDLIYDILSFGYHHESVIKEDIHDYNTGSPCNTYVSKNERRQLKSSISNIGMICIVV